MARSPIQPDSSSGMIFGCRPRHQVRMLVPDRGEPTTKIGLFFWCCILLNPDLASVRDSPVAKMSASEAPCKTRLRQLRQSDGRGSADCERSMGHCAKDQGRWVQRLD